MGNSQSDRDDGSSSKGRQHEQINPETTRAFCQFNKGNPIQFTQFKAKIGMKLAESLWNYLHDDGNSNEEISLESFAKYANVLKGLSSVQLVNILMPSEHLLDICMETRGVPIKRDADAKFMQSLIAKMGSNAESVTKWIYENCPRLCDPIRNQIHAVFHGRDFNIPKQIGSDILSPLQIFILQQSLPTTIFWPKPASHANVSTSDQQEEDWILLYSSNQNGLSVNRFETNVFEYKGSTTIIFRLNSKEIFAIAADEEWRHSCKPFGGPNSVLFKFAPDFRRMDLAPSSIYCNFKNRTSKMGLSCGHEFTVDEDLSNVEQIEAWGCAGLEVLDEQKKMKLRHKLQAERNAKCPMPGNWNENPDKNILELGGVKFTNERRDHQTQNQNDNHIGY